MEVVTPRNNADVTSGILNNADDSNLDKDFGTVDSRSDPLQAVKLDPAVLEAHVTFDITPITKKTIFISDHPTCCDESRPGSPSTFESFESIVAEQEAALLSLAPGLLDLLLRYADTLRSQRNTSTKKCTTGCAFCKKNGEAASWYSCHQLRDGRGRVRCPVLRGLRCPRCGATGDRAHTIKYCPQ